MTAGDAAPLFRIERRGAIAVARLACGKGNALNPRSLAAIEAALEAAVGTAARGVVLAGDGRFFSAGLDLVSLYDVERRAMDGFMRLFDRVMLRVFAFPRPVVAAVDGHAVAGGAILALACDERVMGEGDGRFGLNEIRLGVPFPASALEIVRYAVPPAAAERALYRGELVEPREALARGLVTAVSGGDVVADAVERCERLAEQPSEAFSTIKAALKEPAVERARVTMDPLRRTFVEAWYGPDARRLIGEVRVRLGGREPVVGRRGTSASQEDPMDIEAAIASIWAHTERRSFFPAEWKGRLTIEQAYQVQLGLLDRYLARGERQAGWKVGLTAPVIQAQFGMHEPVMGFLLESGHRDSGVAFRFEDLIEPGFENELCLTVGTRLRGPGVTREQARAAVTRVQPAFEIIEGRGDFRGDLSLALTDNSQQKAFVTGAAGAFPADWTPAATVVEILVNGATVERTVGSERTGDPFGAVAWLANKLAAFGRAVEAGHRIMSGSFTKQYPIARGDRIEARFAPFGAVRASF